MEQIKDIHVLPNTQQITHSGGALVLNIARYDCFIITLNADLSDLSLSGTVKLGEDYKIAFVQGATLRTVTLPSTILVKGDTVSQINQINTKTSLRFTGISSTELLQDGVAASQPLEKASQLEAETGTDSEKYLTSSTGYLGWLSWVENKPVASLNTINKTVVEAINEIRANPVTDGEGTTANGNSINIGGDITTSPIIKIGENSESTFTIRGYESGVSNHAAIRIVGSDVGTNPFITLYAGPTFSNRTRIRVDAVETLLDAVISSTFHGIKVAYEDGVYVYGEGGWAGLQYLVGGSNVLPTPNDNSLVWKKYVDDLVNDNLFADGSVTNIKLSTEVEDRIAANDAKVTGAITRSTQVSSTTLDFTNKDVIVFTNTLAANLEITSLTGIGTGTKWLVVKPDTYTVSFSTSIVPTTQQAAGWKLNDTLIITIENVGTLDVPNYFINRWASISGSQIVSLLNATLGSTDWQSGGAGGSLKVFDEITSNLVELLNTTPFTLKTAPGSGIIDTPREAWVYIPFNTTAYNTNTTLQLISGSTVIGTCDCLGATASGWYKFTMSGQAEENAILSMSVATGNPIGGNSHIGIIVIYDQVNVNVFTFPSYLTAPDPPTSLVATANNPDVDLTWVTPVDNGGSEVIGFRIERNTDAAGWGELVANTGNTNEFYTDSNPGNGTHDYRVYAINAIGTSIASNSDSAIITGATSKTLLVNFGNTITNPQNIGGTDYYYNNAGDTSAVASNVFASPVDSDGNALSSVNMDIVSRAQGNDAGPNITVDTDNILNSVIGTDGARVWTGGYDVFEIKLTGLVPSSAYALKGVGRRALYDSTLTMGADAQSDGWIMQDGNTSFGEIAAAYSDENGELIVTFTVTAGVSDTSAYICGLRVIGLMS